MNFTPIPVVSFLICKILNPGVTLVFRHVNYFMIIWFFCSFCDLVCDCVCIWLLCEYVGSRPCHVYCVISSCVYEDLIVNKECVLFCSVNFLIANFGNETFLEWDLLIKKSIYTQGTNSFLYELIAFEKGDRNWKWQNLYIFTLMHIVYCNTNMSTSSLKF